MQGTELVEVKDRELAKAQQQLKMMVIIIREAKLMSL